MKESIAEWAMMITRVSSIFAGVFLIRLIIELDFQTKELSSTKQKRIANPLASLILALGINFLAILTFYIFHLFFG